MFEIKSLSKTYHNKSGSNVVLNDLNFKLGNSGIVFLFGKSGEGKSTLLNAMAGLDRYDKGGLCLYNGQDIMTMSQKQRDAYRAQEIGLIFERDNYVDCLTVRENIAITIPLSGNEITEDVIMESLDKVQLKHLADRKLYELSSGELQRVAIARILATKPKVLFVDEPTGHLDEENSEIFWKTAKEISKNTLVIAITHEKDIVKKYADRVLEIKAGRIISDTYKSAALKKEDEKLFAATDRPKYSSEIVPHLGIKTSFKLSWKFLTKNLFKFISMQIVICLTLMMFGVNYTIKNFDTSQILARSSIQQGVDYVAFENSTEREVTDQNYKNVHTSYTGQFFNMYSIYQVLELDSGSPIVFQGMLEAVQSSDSEYNSIGQKVLYGRYPLDTDPNNRVAISDYFANYILKRGATFYEGNAQGHIGQNSELKDFIGKSFSVEGLFYEVAAIYETNYRDYVDEDFNVKEGCEADFEYYYRTVYSVVHIVPNKVEDILRTKPRADNVTFNMTSHKVETFVNNYNIISQGYADYAHLPYAIYGQKQVLTAGEVILPLTFFNRLYETRTTVEWPDATEDVFYSIIGENPRIRIKSASGYDEEFLVVGLTPQIRIIFADNDDLNVERRIGDLVSHCSAPINGMVIPVTDEATLTEQITVLKDNGFVYTGRYSNEILGVTNLIDELDLMFVAIAETFTIFSLFLMFTFFVTFASVNKRSIGALRTMGANAFNLFAIFVMSCMIIGLIGIVGGVVLTQVSTAILNGILSAQFGIPISMFNMSYKMLSAMLLLCFGITVLGCAVPIVKYSMETPAEVVKA